MAEGYRPRERHDGWTAERRAAFLAALAEMGGVRDAARAAGLSNVAAYRLRRRDPDFAAAWDAALARSARSLEAVAYARAVEGVEEPVFQGGRQVGTKRRTSDALLRLLLQGADPERYGRTGRQPSVQAREQMEARVKEIEHDAYRRAWAAFSAEYRYEAEPAYLQIAVVRKLSIMHTRLCGNACCRECHPERFTGEPDEWDYNTYPGDDHRPLDAPATWMEEESRAPIAERIAANREGRALPMPKPRPADPDRPRPPPGPLKLRPCRPGETAPPNGKDYLASTLIHMDAKRKMRELRRAVAATGRPLGGPLAALLAGDTEGDPPADGVARVKRELREFIRQIFNLTVDELAGAFAADADADADAG